MGDINVQRQDGELIIRVNADDLDFAFIEKLNDRIFWEYIFRKAGFEDAEIVRIFKERDEQSVEDQSSTFAKRELTDEEIEAWGDAIKQEWWERNEAKFLERIKG
jgi:hypothetical protein